MNQNTWISWVTTGVGIAAGAALDRGLIDASTATSIGGAAAALIPLLWGLFIHRDSKVVQTASLVSGVEPIKIDPAAAPVLQELARDSRVPTVQPSAPTYVPPTASMRR